MNTQPSLRAMQEFDLIVIGSGAGLDVANGVAEQGLRVAIVEKGPLGGTCLNEVASHRNS